MNDILSKLLLEILDIEIERNREQMFSIDRRRYDYTIIHRIASFHGYRKHGGPIKRLSFMSKIVYRFPPQLLSMQNSDAQTPYDLTCNEIDDFFPVGKDWFDQVADVFKPR